MGQSPGASFLPSSPKRFSHSPNRGVSVRAKCPCRCCADSMTVPPNCLSPQPREAHVLLPCCCCADSMTVPPIAPRPSLVKRMCCCPAAAAPTA
eukprot:352499-Chlamydomonas_euryale.AAC.2